MNGKRLCFSGLLVMAAMVALLVSAGQPAAAAVSEGPMSVVHPGAVAGVVMDTNREAVEGAIVQLRHPHGGRVIAVTRSNENGRFAFRHLRPGLYFVTAFKRDVGHGRGAVGVRHGHVSRVRIVLHE